MALQVGSEREVVLSRLQRMERMRAGVSKLDRAMAIIWSFMMVCATSWNGVGRATWMSLARTGSYSNLRYISRLQYIFTRSTGKILCAGKERVSGIFAVEGGIGGGTDVADGGGALDKGRGGEGGPESREEALDAGGGGAWLRLRDGEVARGGGVAGVGSGELAAERGGVIVAAERQRLL